jgi:glycosyltransferase involved in cell wall biosynthesis
MPFLFRSYFRLNMGRILKEADFIFPISEGTGQKLYTFYGLKHHGVVHPPLKPLPAVAELPSRYGLMPKHYILSVGTLEPRKNFLQLFQIYCDLLKRHPLETLLPLVLIGGGGWKNKKMKEEMALMVSRYPSHIKVVGYLNDQELFTLLSHAYYYVTLSLYEGYGMPLAEARRCGTPVAYFDQIEMKEAAEGDGILLREETLSEQLAAVFLKQQATIYKTPAYASNCQLASQLLQTIANTRNCQKGRP